MSNPKLKHQIGHGRIRANLTVPRGSGTALGGASITVERRMSETDPFAPAATIKLADLDAAIQVLTEMKLYIADPSAKPAKAAPVTPPATPVPATAVAAPPTNRTETPPFTPNVRAKAATGRKPTATTSDRAKRPLSAAPIRRRQLATAGRSR